MPPRPPDPPGLIDLVVRGRIGPGDGAALCRYVRGLLDVNQAGLVVCDVGALTDTDLGTVEALARLQLTAGRLGRKVVLQQASLELQELLDLLGLGGVVPCSAGSPLEARRQTEDREDPLRVEEERDPADPTV